VVSLATSPETALTRLPKELVALVEEQEDSLPVVEEVVAADRNATSAER